MGVMMGANDASTISSLAGRLARLNKQINLEEKIKIKEASKGISLNVMINNLLDSIDPDIIESKALELSINKKNDIPNENKRKEAQEELFIKASSLLNGELIDLLDSIRRENEQKIDYDNIDEVINTGWVKDSIEQAQKVIDEFSEFLENNKNEIMALEIFYEQPFRRREITFEMIEKVLKKLKDDKPHLAPIKVWNAYSNLDNYKGKNPINEITAIVSLIRRVCNIDDYLNSHETIVRRNFKNWILRKHAGDGEKFNDNQMEWLRMIRDHIISSLHFEKDDLEMAPFDSKGGIGKMYQLFGSKIDTLIYEMNEALAA